MARYLVTGGCGFIGSHLCDQLVSEGHEVLILDDLSSGFRENPPHQAKFTEGTICDEAVVESLFAKGLDGCFHLAAIASVAKSETHWVETHYVNAHGTAVIFAAAAKHKVPVVYASSAAIYGDNPNLPLKETEPHKPLSAYAADKISNEHNARVAHFIHNIPTMGLRFFNVYGPRQDPKSPYSGVISIFIDKLLSDKSPEIHGDGQQSRDFVFVKDVVACLDLSMKHIQMHPETSNVLNVCTGRSNTIAAKGLWPHSRRGYKGISWECREAGEGSQVPSQDRT